MGFDFADLERSIKRTKRTISHLIPNKAWRTLRQLGDAYLEAKYGIPMGDVRKTSRKLREIHKSYNGRTTFDLDNLSTAYGSVRTDYKAYDSNKRRLRAIRKISEKKTLALKSALGTRQGI